MNSFSDAQDQQSAASAKHTYFVECKQGFVIKKWKAEYN